MTKIAQYNINILPLHFITVIFTTKQNIEARVLITHTSIDKLNIHVIWNRISDSYFSK